MYQNYVEKLKDGEVVSFRPSGNSMVSRIYSKQLVTISPNIEDIKQNDVVFCKVKGNFYVHLISALQGDRVQISNNKGHVNGWITRDKVYGKVIKVEN